MISMRCSRPDPEPRHFGQAYRRHWGAKHLMPEDQRELLPGDVVGTI